MASSVPLVEDYNQVFLAQIAYWDPQEAKLLTRFPLFRSISFALSIPLSLPDADIFAPHESLTLCKPVFLPSYFNLVPTAAFLKKKMFRPPDHFTPLPISYVFSLPLPAYFTRPTPLLG